MNKPAYLTVRNVAEHFQVSTRTVERWIEREELPAARLGPKLTRIRPSDLEAFEAKLCPNANSNDPSSTDDSRTPGTSSGPRDAAAVVSLQRRLIR